MEAMIQKRITMVGSAQPFFSKWWCSGAMRKTRLPVSLKEATWTITETVSSTKRPPMMPSTSSCLVITAIGPARRRGQRAGVAHEDHRRRRVEPQEAEAAPTSAPQNTASSPVPGT
jgi:hypothetical protein